MNFSFFQPISSQTGLSAQHYQQLAKLWPTPSSMEISEALLELHQQDARYKLTTPSAGQIPLLDWLTEHFAALMQTHAEQKQQTVAVCASLWHKQLVDFILPSLTALRWRYQLVPQFDVKQLMISVDADGRIQSLSVPAQALHSDENQTLDNALRLVINQIGEALVPIFAPQKVNAKRFWGNLSNAMVQAFTRLSEKTAMENDVSPAINAWLSLILAANALVTATTVEEDGRYFLYVRRQVCCLKYKLDNKRMCKTCNLFSPDEQERFYQNKFLAAK